MNDNTQNKVNLRPLWDAILEVYKVIADICNRHSLRYCASYGTALGAVRHGGFIPWDDDLDIEMPRPDYELFIEIAKKELPEGYSWLDQYNCDTYENPFGKVIVSNENIVDRVSAESGLSLGYGIFVDIFPVDGYPDTKYGILWRKFENILVEMSLLASVPDKRRLAWRSKIAAFIGSFVYIPYYRIKSHKEQCMFYERRAKKLSFGNSKMCTSIGVGHYYSGKAYPVSFWDNLRSVPFENTQMLVHGQVDAYLTLLYGDYMTLPPEDKRKGTHANTALMPWRLGPR